MAPGNKYVSAIGQPVTRVDGPAKVTGRALYTADVRLPGLLFGKCLRSPHPSARILSIDTSQAASLPGVQAVLTAADVPDIRYGRYCRDIPILARDRALFMGEKIAAVAADSAETAAAALDLIVVEYEVLPAVFDAEQAMTADAPILHSRKPAFGGHPEPLGTLRVYPDIPNVVSQLLINQGDAAAAFARAARTFEHDFSIPSVHQGYLEPHGCVVAIGEDGLVDVWATNKSPFVARMIVSEAIGVPPDRLRFNPVMIGGDFGGKGSVMDTILCYYLARKARRPVKMMMTYEEELTAGNPRHAATIRVRTALDADANILAMAGRLVFNTGAYAGFTPLPMLYGFRKFAGAYRVPNCTLDVLRVYTNTVPGGHMRSPGSPQINFAVESHIDMIAHQIGMDPLELRRRNAIVDGDLSPMGEKRSGIRCVEAIEAGAQAFDWAAPRPPHVGRGVSLYEFPPATFGPSNVTLTMRRDGRVTALVGAADAGTGFLTVAAQLVAGRLGIPLSDVDLVQGDTLTAGFDVGGSGSRLTITINQAITDAAGKMNQALLELASERLNCAPSDVQTDEEGRFVAQGAAIDRRGLMQWAAERGKAPIVCKGMNTPGKPDDITSFAAQFAEVEVDPETGQVRVRRVVTAHDVGTIINPITHQGQIDGGVAQAFGQAMTEHLIIQDGIVITPHLGEYKLPTIMDVPELTTVLVPNPEAGLSDPRAIGEISNVALGAAIANAVFDAVGVRLSQLPLRAEMIFEALEARTLMP